MNIYFVRHGQTEYNLIQKMQGGSVDSPLTEKGIQQARQTGKELKQIKFDQVYSSNQGRAIQTAENILKENLHSSIKIEKVAAFREMEFGTWEGHLLADLEDVNEFRQLRKFPEQFTGKTNGGENYQKLVGRATIALQEIIQKDCGKENILIVSHGLTITSLVNTLAGKSIANIREGGLVRNASISLIQINSLQQIKVEFINEYQLF